MKKALLISTFLTLAVAVPMPAVAADTDRPKDTQTESDEQKQSPRLEKGKPSEPEGRSDWKINVWPVQPPDEIKSLPQMKDENRHTPPDRP